MLSILLIWGTIFFLALVYGFALVCLISFRPPDAAQPSAAVIALLGLALLSSLAGLLLLVINLGLAAMILIFMVGLVLGLWQRRALGKLVQDKIRMLRRMHWLTLAACLAVLVVILLKTVQPPQNYDTGLYHAQAIRWMETYPTIPGLGNLYDRIVLNSNGLLLSALFSFAFLGLQSFHGLNGFLALLTTCYALGKADRLLKGEVTLSNLTAVLLPFLLRRIFSLELSSPGTDLPAALIVWIIVVISLEKIEAHAEDRFDFNFLAVTTLSLLAVTVKLSTLPVLLLPLYLTLRQGRSMRKARFAGLALAAGLLLPWMARSAVQSGYLVYPLPAVNLIHPDWQIPAENARGTAQWIRSWAKIATPDREAVERMPLTAWVPAWYRALVPLDRQILLLNVAAAIWLVILLAYRVWGRERGGSLFSPYWIVYLTLLVGLAFWFAQAPAMRFGYAFLAMFPAICIAPLITWAMARFRSIRGWLSLLLLIGLALYQGISVYRLASPQALRPLLLLPADYPRVETEPHPLGSETIYTPTTSDQCWYEPFPCVPAIPSDIEPRGPALQDGFRYRR